jgi:hypothetical protein
LGAGEAPGGAAEASAAMSAGRGHGPRPGRSPGQWQPQALRGIFGAMPARARTTNLRCRPLAATALGVVALIASACGEDEKSDPDQVKEVVSDFYAALADGDGAKACDLVTGSAEARLSLRRSSCEEAVNQAGERLDDDLKEELRKIEVKDIKVEGDEATCTATANRVARLELKKQGGDWKITDL